MYKVYVIKNLKTNQYWDGNFHEFDGLGFSTTKYVSKDDAKNVFDYINENSQYDLYLSIDEIYITERD